jgi:O-antigen ligase
LYSITQTNGLIEKRYAGKDALGRSKESKFSGREDLVATELKIFYDNPIIGCGVGRSSKIRAEETGTISASHNEITRLLAEHGVLGILILLILFFVPFFSYFNNRRHIFSLPLVVFWLLTINHAAMRIAAPAFLYALSLLKVVAPIVRINKSENLPENNL